jgi:hypothetical protein
MTNCTCRIDHKNKPHPLRFPSPTCPRASHRREHAELRALIDAHSPSWTEYLSLGNLMRFGAFWVVLAALVQYFS